MESKPLRHTHTYFLTAGECNAEGLMPVTLMAERVIEVATEHANILNIGYARLKEYGIAWVLSRLSIEMTRWPGINETYSLTTYIEGFNRLYSDRCFTVTDGNGNEIGHVRSVWVAIDVATRMPADLTVLDPASLILPGAACPIARQRKMPPVAEPTLTGDYQFRYCDLDFNGHVNSVRYIEHLLNLWGPAHYGAFPVRRFEIAYLHECFFDERVVLKALEVSDSEPVAQVDVVRDDVRVVTSRIFFDRK